METWKNIEGFPNYKVSSFGRVKSLKRAFVPRDIILIPQSDPQGYQMVGLRKNGKLHKHSKRIHRLVMMAFNPNNSPNMEVNHKDGDKRNNKLSNLEWTTRTENAQHSWDIGLHNYFLSGKLDRVGVLAIRDACKAGHNQDDIAKYFKISQQHVSAINRGRVLSTVV